MSQETLFHEALATPPDQRAAYLDAACTEQPQLRADIEALLAASEDSGNPLDRPPPGLRPDLDRDTPLDPLDSTILYQPPIERGLVIAGRYRLVHQIGEGGMAAVWLAQQTEPVKRKVALKLIKASMNSKAVLSRFEQERQALALMNHSNIARVLDGGLTPDGRPFFVMDLVNGLALNRFCDQARLPLRQRLELFVPICHAVQHAHQKGIIHRDLKPSNILVTTLDGKPVPKVIDFGLAKATASSLIEELPTTQHGTMLGTLEYMAPEQSGNNGMDIDTRADIYSLGVILYELLTGLRPFDTNRLREAAWPEMLRILREEEPSKPSTRLSTGKSSPSLAALRQTEPRKLIAFLRGELDWVVMKCLEKQRDRRYATANGLARDIQRYLADEPVEARPPSTRYRLGKFLRRNKGAAVGASLVLLTLIGGLIGTTLEMVRAEKAEHAWQQAEAKRREAEKEQERLRQKSLDYFPPVMREELSGLPLALPNKPPDGFFDKKNHRLSLGLTYQALGHQCFYGNQLRESLGWYNIAIETLSAVCQEYPQWEEAKSYLSRSYRSRAQAYDFLQRHSEAISDKDSAIEFCPKADKDGICLARSWSRVQAGQLTEGLAEVEVLMRLSNWTVGELYVFSCIYAVASSKSSVRKQQYADRAMELLYKAVKAGYANAAHMREDRDLDSLRGRDDFQKLIQELETKAGAQNERRP